MAIPGQEQLDSLLLLLRGGNTEALDGIWACIGGRMFALARGIVKNRADAEDVRFAACVAEFALVLRRSQYAGSASIANVLARLNELRAGFADDVYKTEFVQIVSLAGESGFYGAQEQENEAR